MYYKSEKVLCQKKQTAPSRMTGAVFGSGLVALTTASELCLSRESGTKSWRWPDLAMEILFELLELRFLLPDLE